MYKPIDKLQHSFLDFNQPMGLKMNPENRWIKLADLIPWDEFEAKYAEQFPSGKGNVAKPLRMALGALIIQTKFQYSGSGAGGTDYRKSISAVLYRSSRLSGGSSV